MGQLTEATISMFKELLAKGKHINSTCWEEKQLVLTWEHVTKIESENAALREHGKRYEQMFLDMLKVEEGLREQYENAVAAVSTLGADRDRLREQLADQQAYARTRGDEMLGATQRIDALEKQLAEQSKQIEELTAALAVKNEALQYAADAFRELAQQCDGDYETAEQIEAALAIQPHAALVAKIKADAVQEFCRAIDSIDDGESPAYRHVQEFGGEYAARIEKGGVK